MPPQTGPSHVRSLVVTYNEASNAGDFERAASVFAVDATLRDAALGRVYVGRDEIRRSAAGWSESWPTTMRILDLHADALGYAYTWVMEGVADTRLDELALAGSGQRWTLRGASAGEVAAGGITEHRSYWNLFELLAQFGDTA